ncbi:hypothetical protein Y032_0139g2144 [Ancylostoma ceylanicum]|uniref:Uncharacterized protein n=1 Tax=Ancylostoma ceylanicum TaxID=53326 RepID=A0A016T4I6_9BILA|nr:hypothetical protein Y032_0139g2144 [Ancylostoma ceylanicum]
MSAPILPSIAAKIEEGVNGSFSPAIAATRTEVYFVAPRAAFPFERLLFLVHRCDNGALAHKMGGRLHRFDKSALTPKVGERDGSTALHGYQERMRGRAMRAERASGKVWKSGVGWTARLVLETKSLSGFKIHLRWKEVSVTGVLIKYANHHSLK